MTPAEREFALHHLAESRENLLRLTHGLSPQQWHYRSAPGRWTVAECVEHVVTVETRVLDRIQDTVQKGPDPSRRSALEGRDHTMFADAVARVVRLQAPEILVPTGRSPRYAKFCRQHPIRFTDALLQASGIRRPRPLSMAHLDCSPL